MSARHSTRRAQDRAPGRRRRRLAAAFASVLLAACAEPDPTPGIGLLLPPATRAVAFAREALDSLSAEAGRPAATLVPAPPGTSDRPALTHSVSRASRLSAADSVIVVVGPPSSTEVLLVAPIFAEVGLPLVAPTSTALRLRDAGPLVFRLAPDDSLEGAWIAEFAAERLNARTATVFHVVDAYGSSLEAGIVAGLEAHRVQVLDRVPYRMDLFCPTTNPYDVLLDASLRRGVPDVVIVAGRVGETACIARAVSERHPGLPVVAGDGSTPTALLRDAVATEGTAEDLWVVTFWHEGMSPEARRFADAFERRFGERPDGSDALTYDAVRLAAAAIEAAGRDRSAAARWLERLGRGAPAYDGVTGPIAFDASAKRPLYMVRVGDGTVVERQAR